MNMVGFQLLKQPSRSSTLGKELFQKEKYMLLDRETAASDDCETTLQEGMKLNLNPLLDGS